MMKYRKELVKLLQHQVYHYGIWEIFSDFIEVSAIAVSNLIDKRYFDSREKQYLSIIKKYDKETVVLFPRMLSLLIMEIEQCNQEGNVEDILGQVFHELNIHDKWKGQFFSPPNIANMMGILTFDSKIADKSIREKGYITVNEPCCGSGSLLYGFINAMQKAGYSKEQCVVYASDIDMRCVYMTYLQCYLYGIPAIVKQMNAFSMQSNSPPFLTPACIRLLKENNMMKKKIV